MNTSYSNTIKPPHSSIKYPWMAIFKRALIIAIVLGSLLTLFNQPGAIFGNEKIQVLPLILVILTPFVVVSISQALGIRAAFNSSVQEKSRGFLGTLFTRKIIFRALALGLSIGIANILIVIIVNSSKNMDQLPLALMFQGLTLPVLFGAISQTISFRRAVAQLAHA